MSKTIEVYVRNEEVPTKPVLVQTVPGHPCTSVECYKSEKIIPETDQSALKVAEEVSKETGAKLKIYNISTLKGRMRARLKGIKDTPTIVIGENKIKGVPKRDQLVSLLKMTRHPCSEHSSPY